jgi:hypothetical protein
MLVAMIVFAWVVRLTDRRTTRNLPVAWLAVLLDLKPMFSETTKTNASATTMIGPGRFLRILSSYVRPYRSRGLALVVTLLVEGAFNILLALSL